MSEIYIIQNQHQQFLDKHGDWVDGRESQTLYRTTYKDEAINVKVEHAVRNADLRLTVIPAKLDERGKIALPESYPSSTSIDSSSTNLFTGLKEICCEAAPSDTIEHTREAVEPRS